jgi:hypothetical protein
VRIVDAHLHLGDCRVFDADVGEQEGVGADRLMLGSDALENLPIELPKYRSLGLGAGTLERCLGGAACEVFSV